MYVCAGMGLVGDAVGDIVCIPACFGCASVPFLSGSRKEKFGLNVYLHPFFLKRCAFVYRGGGRNCPISAALSEPSDSAGWSRQTDRSSQTAPGVVLSEAQCYEPTTPEARTQVETRTLQLYLHTQMCHAHAEN